MADHRKPSWKEIQEQERRKGTLYLEGSPLDPQNLPLEAQTENFAEEVAKVDADRVTHPSHYNALPGGIECIDVVQHFNFNRGNAIKYLWRAGLKGDVIEDLRKAAVYVQFEITRIQEERDRQAAGEKE